MAEKIVVIFDFDKTIIELDSDVWVVEEMGFAHLFNDLLPTMPWNSLMVRMMGEIHAYGKTVEDMAEILRRTPIHPRVVAAIKFAFTMGCDLRIVSDANMFFIETILDHHGIKECFSEINTNPCYVDENGKLTILPYHHFQSSPHGCNLCPSNMCKGTIIERIQVAKRNEKFIYVGDGKNDYCPTLKLKEGDYMMPRKNYPVWDLITKNLIHIKAEIHEWSSGEEFEKVLLKLIQIILATKNTNHDSVGFISTVECKLHSMDTFTQPLSVLH